MHAGIFRVTSMIYSFYLVRAEFGRVSTLPVVDAPYSSHRLVSRTSVTELITSPKMMHTMVA